MVRAVHGLPGGGEGCFIQRNFNGRNTHFALYGYYIRVGVRTVHADGERSGLVGKIYSAYGIGEGGGVVNRSRKVGYDRSVCVCQLISFSRAERICRLPGERHGIYRLIVRSCRRRLVFIRLGGSVEQYLFGGCALPACRIEFGVYLYEVGFGCRNLRGVYAGSFVKGEAGSVRRARIEQRSAVRIGTAVYLIIYAACRAVLVPYEHYAVFYRVRPEIQVTGEIHESAEQTAEREVFRQRFKQIHKHSVKSGIGDDVLTQSEVIEIDVKGVLLVKQYLRNGFAAEGDSEFDYLLAFSLPQLYCKPERRFVGSYAQVDGFEHILYAHVHAGNKSDYFAHEVGYAGRRVGQSDGKFERAVEQLVEQPVKQRVVSVFPTTVGKRSFDSVLYTGLYVAAYMPVVCKVDIKGCVETGTAAPFGSEQIAAHARGKSAVSNFDFYNRLALQELASVEVDIQSEGRKQVEHAGQSRRRLQQAVIDGYIDKIIIIYARRGAYHFSAAGERSYGRIVTGIDAVYNSAKIYCKVVIGNCRKQRCDKRRHVEVVGRYLVYGQFHVQNLQPGRVEYHFVFVQIQTDDYALFDDIAAVRAAERERFVGVQLQIHSGFFIVRFVYVQTGVERQVEIGVIQHFYLQIAQIETEYGKQVAQVVSTFVERNVQTYTSRQTCGESACHKVVEVGSILRFVAEDSVHVFGKRSIALFDGLKQFERVKLDAQIQTVQRKSDGNIPQTVAAGSKRYGARTEVGDSNAGSIYAEAAYRRKHAVDKRLVYRYIQAVVIFALGDAYPVGSVLYFKYLEYGYEQIRPILADVHVAVLGKGKSDHRAFGFGKVRFARYLSVVRAEEFVEEVNGDFLNVFDEFGQRERNGKALAVPHGGGTGKTFRYLSDIDVKVAFPIIYARDYLIIMLRVLDFNGYHALVLDVAVLLVLRVGLLGYVEVDGEIQPVIEIRLEHKHAFGKSAGLERIDKRGYVNLSPGSAESVKRDARGKLDMSEAVCIGVILHLGRNDRKRFFVPVRAHDCTALKVVRNFTGVVIGERGVYGNKITRTVHRSGNGERAVGNDIFEI